MPDPDTLDISGYLADLDFPVSKQDLIATTAAQRAPDWLIEILQTLSREQFDSEDAIDAALAQATSLRPRRR